METVTLEKKQFDELTLKIDKIITLLAFNLLKDCKNQNEKIILLSNFGYSPTEIADLLKTSPNTVSVALNRAKKAKNKES